MRRTSRRRFVLLVVFALAISACGPPTEISTAPIGSVPVRSADATSLATATPATVTSLPSPSSSAGLIPIPPIVWRRHVLPDGAYQSVIHVDERILAVGSIDERENSVWVSDDGLAWRVLAESPFGNDRPWAITSIDDRLVVLARRPFGDGSQTVVWRSADGAEWEPWIEPEGFRQPHALARFQDRWLMQSVNDGGIDMSRDGMDWTRVVDLETTEAAGFALGPGGIVAGFTVDNPTSFQAAILSTVDGDDWTSTLLDRGGIAMLDTVSADESTYVALGRARLSATPFTGAAWWSTDGTTWQRATVPKAFESAEWFSRHVGTMDGTFVAATQLGVEGQLGLLGSSDGRTWVFFETMPQMFLSTISVVVLDDRLLLYGTELEGAGPGVVWEGSFGP